MPIFTFLVTFRFRTTTTFKIDKVNGKERYVNRIDAFPPPDLNNRERLKWYCDESRIFPIAAILKHEQVAFVRRKMLFTTLKYLFSVQKYSSF